MDLEDTVDPVETTPLTTTLTPSTEVLDEPDKPAEDPPGREVSEKETSNEPRATKQNEPIIVGGKLGEDVKPCLFLLDGLEDMDKLEEAPSAAMPSKFRRVTIGIHRLPATLGRSSDSKDPNFVPMGAIKAVSRQHMRIEYWYRNAPGPTKTSSGSQEIVYRKLSSEEHENDSFKHTLVTPESSGKVKIIRKANKRLPERGFYVVTCLGKNRIMVDGERILQGQTALLESGAAIRVASLCLYFFAPKATSKRSVQVNHEGKVVDKVTTGSKFLPDAPKSSSSVAGTTIANKKRRISLTGVSSAIPAVSGSGTGAGIAPPKRSLQTDVEEMSTTELLDQMKDAMENGKWERRHQLIGSTISYRAVLAAGKSLKQRQVSRGDIMDWIVENVRYEGWVKFMLTKMEAKSYQSSITKALIKAGFERTASTGRYIKWNVPANLLPLDMSDNENEDGPENAAEGGDESGSDDDGSEKEAANSESDESGDDEGGSEKIGNEGEAVAPPQSSENTGASDGHESRNEEEYDMDEKAVPVVDPADRFLEKLAAEKDT